MTPGAARPEALERIVEETLALRLAADGGERVRGLSDDFYRDELRTVVLPRGPPLTARDRAAVWPVFAEIRRRLEAEGLITRDDMLVHAVELVRDGRVRLPFRHVVVDETQDIEPGPGTSCT